MSIYNPCPLPLLLPRVDLLHTTTIGTTNINPGLYRSVFHALGLRYRSDTLFGSSYKLVANTSKTVSFGYGGTMNYGYGNANASAITGIVTGSGSTPILHGGVRYSQSSGSADWGREDSSTTSCSFYLGSPTTYTVAIAGLENLFAGYEYYRRAVQSFNSITNYIYYPWSQTWLKAYSQAYSPTADWYAKLPVYSLPGDANATLRPIGFEPSRPLRSQPVLVEEERVNQLVSLSGRSYRRSYSRRRIYEVTLLLDGGPSHEDDDPLAMWHKFLSWADCGVTLWIDRGWLSQFWRPSYAVVCPNMPNEISGALLEASSLRFAARDGIPDAYEVTLLISEETGCQPFLYGVVPEWL